MKPVGDVAEGRHESSYGRDRVPVALVLSVFLLIAIAYVASVPGLLFVKPDTMVYLGLARSLARGAGYTFNLGPYAKYPPVFPLMLSVVYRAVGEGARVAVMQGMVALMGVGAIAAAYAVVRARAGARVALGVAVLTATCSWFWSFSSAYLLAEVPYTLLSLLTLWAAERALRSERLLALRWLGVAAAATAAICTHVVGVALLPAVVGGALFGRARQATVGQRLWSAALAGALCAGAAGYWVARGRGLPEMATYTGHLVEQSRELGAALEKAELRVREYTAAPLSRTYRHVRGWAGLAAFAVLLVPGLVRELRRERGCLEFYLCGHFAVTALMGGETGHERYVVPVVPLLYYYGYVSLACVSGWAAWALGRRRRDAGARGRAPRALVAVAMAVIISYGLVYRARGKRGARPFSAEARAEARRLLAAWHEAERWAREEMPKDARVCAGSGGSWCIVHYFTERATDAPVRDEITPPELAAAIARWGSDYVVADTRPKTVQRLWPLLASCPACFPELRRNRSWAAHPREWRDHGVWKLHRVDQAKLARLLAQWNGKGANQK